jgi:hypothetical protein
VRVAAIALLVLVGCTPIAESPSSRATDPASGVTPATVAAATPTPEPTIRKKIGGVAEYVDRWRVTAVRWSDQPAGRFSSPKPGNRFVVVIVRYDNGTPKVGHFNALDWKLQDSAGVRRTYAFFSDRDDLLSSGDLAPGGFVSGSLVFEVPQADNHLELIYEGIGYTQATWELY